MKLKFAKNYLTFKKDETHDIEDADVAKDLVTKGYATEVVETEADVAKGVEELVTKAAADGFSKGVEEARKELAKSVKGYRPSIVVGDDNNIQKRMTLGELKKKATAFSESTEPYSLPIDYSTEFVNLVNPQDALISKVSNYKTKGNTYRLTVDAQTVIGQSPVTGAWVAEGACATPANGQLTKGLQFTLNKYFTVYAITNEELEDNMIGIEGIAAKKAMDDIVFNTNYVIVRGLGSVTSAPYAINSTQAQGNSQPLGILNSKALLTVTPSSATEYTSTGDYFNFADLKNMKAHFYKRPNGNAPVWLMNPALQTTAYDLKDAAGRNLYFAPGTVQYAPQESLFGIPIVWSYACSAPGTPGDVILADLSAYAMVTKTAGIESAKSTEYYFVCDKTAYRFGFRLDGMPELLQPIAGPDGSLYSSFVVLGPRS